MIMDRSSGGFVDVDLLSAWLARAGVQHSGIAVDFADVCIAAVHVQQDLQELLTLDPQDPESADSVLRLLGRIRAWMLVEIPHHIDHLRDSWEVLEKPFS
jgi:hypothetical protein